MPYYLYRCEGCSVIKCMNGFGGEKAEYGCRVCDAIRMHRHINKGEIYDGAITSGEEE